MKGERHTMAASNTMRRFSDCREIWEIIRRETEDLVIITDSEGNMLMASGIPFFATMGVDEALLGKVSDLLGEKMMRPGLSEREIRYPVTCEKTVSGKTYRIKGFRLSVRGRELTLYLIKDITELSKLKEQLYHSDKLACLGMLVSGVAHEINNPLTGVIAYTELLSKKVFDSEVQQELDKILNSAGRCKRIIENLLTFSRQQRTSMSLGSINDIADRAVDLRSYWLRTSNIEVIREYGKDIPTVYADFQQIQQVILNILINAEQAINDTRRRNSRILLTTWYNSTDKKVCLKITDNGRGMQDVHIPHIFEPFYTTKPAGIGTGLGLSISNNIIAEHGGRLWLESSSSEGTTFAFELPAGKFTPCCLNSTEVRH